MIEDGGNVPTRPVGDECDDLLALLSPPGEAMDFDWLLDENAAQNMRLSPGEEAAAVVVSPSPSLEPWRNWQQQQQQPAHLRNVTAITRSLAVTNDNALHDQSHVSRSLATPPLASPPNTIVKTEPQLANMSAVSHNLANVGALPQCNQRHARCVAPVAVAEDTTPPHAVVVDMDQQQLLQQPSSPQGSVPEARTLLDLTTQQQHHHQQQQFRFSAAVVPANNATGAKPRGRRLQRTAATDDQNKKLEMRRTKNREAAERMRRRRREETAGLEKTVRELTLRVDELSAKLAASEAENEQLRGLKQLVFAVATQPQPADDAQDPATTKVIADQQHQTSRVMPQEQN